VGRTTTHLKYIGDKVITQIQNFDANDKVVKEQC